MTTNAKTNATPDEMKEELEFYIRGAKVRFEEAQTKFLADATTNPASAILWSSENMVRVQTEYEVWIWIERATAKEDPKVAIKKMLEEVRYRVRSFFGSNSTSMFSNAVERAKAEAHLRLVDELEGLAKHYGI